MDTAKAPSVTESSGQHLRRDDIPPVSQVPEVQNPVESPSSVPAEGNNGNKAKKTFFERIWSQAKGRFRRKSPGNEERHFRLHTVRQLPPAHQRGPSDPSGFVNLGRQDPRARDPKVVKYPDSGPDRCVMCNRLLHDFTSNFESWKRCETRVYLPCGHPFGHRCLHSYLTERLRSRTPESDAIIVGGEHYCPMGGCIPIRHECDHLAIPTFELPQPRYEDQESQIIPRECGFCSSDPCAKRRINQSPANKDLQEQNAIRRSIGAPEIAIIPGQQEQSNLPTCPSTEMRENRSQAGTIKQKTAEIPPVVGNADDPDAITPAEAPTSWKLPEFAKALPFEVPTPGDPTPGETGRSAVGAASTNGTVGSKNKTNPTATNGTASQFSVHKATSDPALGSIHKNTNVGPGGDMTEKKPETVVGFPDPPKDDPKKSAKETESEAKGKRKVAQPIAA
ncbi:hypothetical protein LB503_005420 [Fusarium chuoi]|nr:hypothetical protein LB503_005420 [Fusarium chuoi]